MNKKEEKIALMGEERLWNQLWLWLKPDLSLLLILAFVIIVNLVLSITGPIYLKQAIELIDQNKDNFSSVERQVLIFAGIFALALVLSFLTTIIQDLLVAKVNPRFINRLRQDAFRKIINNKISFFDKAEAGRITSRVINDSNELLDSARRFADAFSQLIVLIGVLVVMFIYSPIITVGALSIAPVLFITVVAMRKWRRRIAKKWRSKISSVNSRFAEVMGAIEISKAFGREDENYHEFHELNEETYQAAKIRGLAIFSVSPIQDFLRNLGIIVMLYVAALRVNIVGISVVYLFIVLQRYLYDPITAIARSYNRFQSSFAAMERILEIMADKETSEFNKGNIDASDLKGEIVFDNLTFAYENEEYVLKEINFETKPGEVTAIVGHTGAGKTTIVALLSRFYDYKKGNGKIYIDGKEITQYDLKNLRQSIGYVAQDVLLFSGSIRENLQIAKKDATDEELWLTLEQVQAREFIETLPDGLDTEIQEGGKNLSKGQKQMLSLARALLSDPKILVLDEFTASLDMYTEAKIQDAIQKLLEKRTSIVIAHRLTTILKADNIIVLENGKLIEKGTHSELLSKEGNYAKIYKKYFSFQLVGLTPISKT